MVRGVLRDVEGMIGISTSRSMLILPSGSLGRHSIFSCYSRISETEVRTMEDQCALVSWAIVIDEDLECGVVGEVEGQNVVVQRPAHSDQDSVHQLLWLDTDRGEVRRRRQSLLRFWRRGKRTFRTACGEQR